MADTSRTRLESGQQTSSSLSSSFACVVGGALKLKRKSVFDTKRKKRKKKYESSAIEQEEEAVKQEALRVFEEEEEKATQQQQVNSHSRGSNTSSHNCGEYDEAFASCSSTIDEAAEGSNHRRGADKNNTSSNSRRSSDLAGNKHADANANDTSSSSSLHSEVTDTNSAIEKNKNDRQDASDKLRGIEEEELDEDLMLLQAGEHAHWTPAERAFRLAQKKRERQRINERLKFTHRQRMEKLNAHLASLSEHFDQPRVGPG